MTELLEPEKVLKYMMRANRDFFLKKDGTSIPPTFAFYRENGEDYMIAAPFGDDTEKRIVRAALKAKMAEVGDVYMYAFVCEAWATMLPKGEVIRVRPSQSEQRKEIISILVSHRDGRMISQTTEMIRDWKTGKVIELKEEEEHSTIEDTAWDLFGTLS